MSQGITVQPGQVIERILTLELVRVTERAAVAAARLRGHGNEKAADQAAVDAMRRELNRLQIDGTVVIGEGERDEAPMLFIGERVGNRGGPKVDIAVDPLEGIHEVHVEMNARGFGQSSIDYPRSAYYMVKVLLSLFVGLFRRRPTPVEAEGSDARGVDPSSDRSG